MKTLKTEIVNWYLSGVLLVFVGQISAQNVYIHAEQNLSFGEFVVIDDAPGTVKISNIGEYSSSGNVHLLNSNYHPAKFVLFTDNLKPIEVRVEVDYASLRSAEQKEIPFTFPNQNLGIFTIKDDSPTYVFVGGSLEINSDLTSSEEKFNGTISLRVTILEN